MKDSRGIFRALRKAVRTPEAPPSATSPANDAWTLQAGDEFGELSEAARCDLAFALADLGDDLSTSALRAALSDPSEIVALAAAYGLRRLGAMPQNLTQESDGRAQRITQTLALLT